MTGVVVSVVLVVSSSSVGKLLNCSSLISVVFTNIDLDIFVETE